MPPRRSLARRAPASLILTATLGLALLLTAPRCTPPAGPPLQGIHLDATTVHEGETPLLRASTTWDMVEVRVRDARSGVLVQEQTVDGRLQRTSVSPWLGPNWGRSAALSPLLPGLYRVEVPAASIDDDQRLLSSPYRTDQAALVVRPPVPASRGPVLVVLDAATYQAYNDFGGFSYYTDVPVSTVGSRRPGYHAGHLVAVGRVLDVLEDGGIAWELADTDYVEDHPSLLRAYRLVVLVRIVEYCTRPFVDQLADYVEGGGRLLSLANENCVFQSRRVGGLRITHKFPSRSTDPVLLDDDPGNDHLATYEWARLGEPSTRLFGVSYWLARALTQDASWTVNRASHWAFAGTGLADGDSFGLVPAGCCIDGTLLEPGPDGRLRPAHTDLTQTPADLLVLASVPTDRAAPWWCWVTGASRASCEQPGWGVLGIRQNAAGGIVAVFPKARLLRGDLSSVDPALIRVGENLIQTLAAPGPVDAYDGALP